jgi:MFS family permease
LKASDLENFIRDAATTYSHETSRGSIRDGTRPKTVFYGWWVVLTAAIGLLLGYAPIFVFSFGVFAKSLVKEFHFEPDTDLSRIYSCHVMFSFSSPLGGRLVDRFGARRVILPGTLILGLLLISFKFISTSLWQLYVIFLALGLMGGTVQVPHLTKGLLPDGGVDLLAQSEERPEKQGLTCWCAGFHWSARAFMRA